VVQLCCHDVAGEFPPGHEQRVAETHGEQQEQDGARVIHARRFQQDGPDQILHKERFPRFGIVHQYDVSVVAG
jgi:hypothetical protein